MSTLQVVRRFQTKAEAGEFMCRMLGESGKPPPEQAIGGEFWAAQSVSTEVALIGYQVTVTLNRVELVERKLQS